MASPSVNQRIAGRSVSVERFVARQLLLHTPRQLLPSEFDNRTQKGTADYNQAVGEGYYFRAWYYYSLLINYGPWLRVETPRPPTWSTMKLPRENRTVIADHILADLDM